MAELGELGELGEMGDVFEEAGAESGDAAIDSAIDAGVEDQAAEFTDAGVTPEVDDEGNPVEGQDPAEGMKEGADEIGADVKAGKSIGQRFKGAMKTMWSSKWDFAKFIGMEVAKGALFFGGMKAAEKIWDLATASSSDSSSTDDQGLKLVKACNQAGGIIGPIITEWRAWLTAHFDERDKYGTVTVDDIDITRFQILQSKLSEFDTIQDVIHPLAMAVKTKKDLPSAQALLAKWKDYVDKVVALGDYIKTTEALMVADGLKDHSDDLVKATDAINV